MVKKSKYDNTNETDIIILFDNHQISKHRVMLSVAVAKSQRLPQFARLISNISEWIADIPHLDVPKLTLD